VLPPIAESPEKPRGSAQPPAPDLTYYAARQLDVYPALVSPLELHDRDAAPAAGPGARALLLVLIDDTGIVKDVSVVEAANAAFFEYEAKRAFADARFTPAYRDGRAVRSRVLVEVSVAGK
jgi:protein TonB